MVSFKQLILGSVALIAMAGTANAGLATWEDEVTQNEYVSVFNPHTYSHDIKADGFSPFHDHVNSFLLSIDLWDDNDRGFEKYQVNLSFFDNVGQSIEFGADAFQSSMSFLGLVELNIFGTLHVTLSSVCQNLFVCGDFYVGNSTLVAYGESRQVSEPASLALLGLGLLGLGVSRRKKHV